MSESQDSIEQFLIPYATDRLNQKSAKQVKSILMRTVHKEFLDYYAWMIKAFARCIFEVEGGIYLRDMITVIIAEANLATDAPPFRVMLANNFFKTFDSLDFKAFLESEVHRWLVYLQENSKLPGKYNRFTGKFEKS